VSPNRIVRMIQLGMEEEVLNTRTIWACVLCSTCTARCPRDVDVPRIMDALRITAKKRGINNKFKNANAFHDVFMNSIMKHGRVYELGLLIGLKLKQSGTLFEELDIGLPAMLSAGLRIPKLPPKVNNPDEILKIVENCKRMEGEK
jgi:heterodisulfide reductase subunit C